MKTFIGAILLVSGVYAARLERTYIPPGSAGGAGGSGAFLKTPFGGGSSFGNNFGSSGFGSKYNKPSFNAPSSSFNARGSSSSSKDGGARIVKFNNDNAGEAGYRFDFETENKISQQETGQLRNAGTAQEVNEVHGAFSYTDLNGQTYQINYVADENGFQPQGQHLPTPPPIPQEILEGLSRQTGESGDYHGEGESEGSYKGEGAGGYTNKGFSGGFGGGSKTFSGGSSFSSNKFSSFGAKQGSRQYVPPGSGY